LQWIFVVARGTVKQFIEKVTEIEELSTDGAKQLLTDTKYLSNILVALELSETRDLEILKQLLEATNVEQFTKLKELNRPLWEKIKKIRHF